MSVVGQLRTVSGFLENVCCAPESGLYELSQRMSALCQFQS